MSLTDPMADMLTRIRNANMRYHKKVVVEYSTLKEKVLKVLKEEGYLLDYKVVNDPVLGDKKKSLHIYLKYGPDKERIIRQLSRVSKPGRRIYVGANKIPKVMDGLGIAILSTSKGVLSSRRARTLNVGGEVICIVY